MKTLFSFLVLIAVTTEAQAGKCKPDPSCASGQSCLVDMLTGEYQCKVVKDPNEGFVTVRMCQSGGHMPVILELQSSLNGNFDRVVLNRFDIKENFLIALGYPDARTKIIAASDRGHTLEMIPLFGDDVSLKIGDRNLGKATTYTVTCRHLSQHH